MKSIINWLKSVDFSSISVDELYISVKKFYNNNKVSDCTPDKSLESIIESENTKLDFCKKLNEIIQKVNHRKDSIQIYNILFPLLIERIDSYTLFYEIYKVEELTHYTMYLLHKNKVDLNKLYISVYEYLANNTTWGKKFILHNIDIISQNRMGNFILKICTGDNKFYYDALNAFKNQENKLNFLASAIGYSTDFFTEKDIITSIYKDGITEDNQLRTSDEFSLKPILLKNDIGHVLAERPHYHQIASKYSNELFESEKNQKLKFLYLLRQYLDDLCLQYDIALQLYISSNKSYRTDSALSNLINFGNYNSFSKNISKLSSSPQFSSITSDNTASSNVFDLNNYVLKLGNKRFTYNIDTNFFRIIPTNITYVKDNFGNICSIIEFQRKIDTNPENITDEMINELFLDFKKNGLYIADPRCLKFDKSNFGLLRDYKDANLGSFRTHEELPETFKKNPLVLLDVDLIYKYGGIELPPFELLEMIKRKYNSIVDYERIIKIKSK